MLSFSSSASSLPRYWLLVLVVVTYTGCHVATIRQCHAFHSPVPHTRRSTSLDASALIVQNKGGGHGELGYQIAQNLMQQQQQQSFDKITILQDDACKDTQEPFRSYATDLPNVQVVKAPLGSEGITAEQVQACLGEGRFDYVWDNASKNDQGCGRAILDCCQRWNVKLLTYVSSAGMYQPGPEGPFPMPENSTPVKQSAGQYLYEQAAVQAGLPFVSFRPQYIYGPKANKYDYLDWYFDRIVRELPLPVPEDGSQLVSLTNSEDVASILTSPLNNEAAAIQQRIFNCGTDELVSYRDLALFCAEAAGVDPENDVKMFYYDASKLGKGDFPFRPTNFYVTPDLAKQQLHWPGPKHRLTDDLKWYFESYKTRGGLDKKISFAKDWEIVFGRFTPAPEAVMSIYEKYDPIPFDTSPASSPQ